MSSTNSNKVLLIINVDWYFLLHWKRRALFLKNSGYEVIVCTAITSLANKKEIVALGVDLHEIDFVRHKFALLTEFRCLRDLWRVISKENLYLLHAITIKPILFTHLFGLFFDFRSIFTFPGLGQLAIKRNLLNWSVWRLLFVLTRFQYKKNNKIYTFENDVDERRYLKECSKRIRSSVVPGAGVDLQRFYPNTTKPDWPVKILFASRLLKNKGLDAVVRSVEAIVARGFCVELHVAGIVDTTHFDAFSQDELDMLLAKDFIVWHGHCTDMPNLLRLVDVVCLPTQYGEGLPRILLEGAATGLPLVATNIPGCNDVVINDKTGFLVDLHDNAQLTDVLQRLVIDPLLRERFGSRARALVREKMSDKVVCEKTLALYKSIDVN